MLKNKIQKLCQDREITPYRFAKDCGLAERTAYDLFNKPDKIPNGAALDKICTAYDIQPNDVIEHIKESKLPDSDDSC